MKQQQRILSIFTDISLFLFLCTKTFIGYYPILEYASLGSFILFSIINAITSRRFTLKSKYIAWYSLFAVFCGMSFAWSLNSSFTLQSLPSVLALVAFAIAIYNHIRSPKDLDKLIKMYFWVNLIAALKICILYPSLQGTAASRILNITGLYFNTIAQTMAFAAVIAFYYLLKTKKKGYIIPMLILFSAIILSGSRKALLIPLISIALIIMLFYHKNKAVIKYLMLFSIILTIVGAVVILNDSLRQKFLDLFTSLLLGQETEDWSINLRSFFTRIGFTLWLQHPLWGAGLNNFAYYVKNYTDYSEARYAHNNYIELLSSVGLIGFLLYYWFYVYVIVNLFRKLRKHQSLQIAFAITIMLCLSIFELGIVSYSSVMYNLLIFIAFSTLNHSEKNSNKKRPSKQKELVYAKA